MRHNNNFPQNKNNGLDPRLQLTMLTLLQRPDMEQQIERTIEVLKSFQNIMRSVRTAKESFTSSITEAQQHMVGIQKICANNEYVKKPEPKEK